MRSRSKPGLSLGLRSRRIVSLGAGLLLALSLVAPHPAEIHASSPGAVKIVQSDQTGVTLEMTFSSVQTGSTNHEGQTFDVLSIPGLTQTGEAGKPQTPVKGVMVAVPPGSRPQLTVLEIAGGRMEGRIRLAPASKPTVKHAAGDAPALGQEWVPDEGVYGRDALYPEAPASLGETGSLRNQPYVVLRFSPIQYNPARGEAYFWSSIRVRVSFGSARAVSASRPESPVFADLLQKSMVNYRASNSQPGQAPSSVVSSPPHIADIQPVYKISIDREGLYQVTYAQLLAAGFPVDSVDPQNLQLSNNGAEVAIERVVKGDGKLDYILFYGKGVDNKFTGVDVYLLTAGGVPGKRMAVRDGTILGAPENTFTETVHAEENHEYDFAWPMLAGADHWYWDHILATSGSKSGVYTVTLSGVGSGPYTATLTPALQSYSSSATVNPDHHAILYVNDQLVKDTTWDGVGLAPGSASFSQAWLRNGANVIKVELPGVSGVDFDAVAVNWFEITYLRELSAVADYLRFRGGPGGSHTYQVGGFSQAALEVFDVSDRTNVARVNGGVSAGSAPFTLSFADNTANPVEYLAVSTGQRMTPTSIAAVPQAGLKSANNGADLIIITPTEFYTSVLPLADRRAQQGFRVKVANLEDIYNEFGYGFLDPEAIRTFLAYSFASWQPPAPSYVLLMGDGNFDSRDYLGIGEKSYVPPYLAFVDPWLGETASDNAYVTFGNDVMPSMFIGRLPVSSSSQASDVITKILNYEKNATSGDWRRKAVFVTDNPGTGRDYIDFYGLSDTVADSYLPKTYSAQKIYLGATGAYSNTTAVKSEFVNALNRGAVLAQYEGHGTIQYWGKSSIFGNSDVPSLSNGSMLPFVLSLTCLDGYFHYPAFPSLEEKLVLAPDKGAIAAFAATGEGIATGQGYLARGILNAFFVQRTAALGPATFAGKLALYTDTTSYRDLISTYGLLGDPSMNLALPPVGIYLPVLTRRLTGGW